MSGLCSISNGRKNMAISLKEIGLNYVERKVVHMLRTMGPNTAGTNPETGAAIPGHIAQATGVKMVSASKRLHELARGKAAYA